MVGVEFECPKGRIVSGGGKGILKVGDGNTGFSGALVT